MENNMIKIWGNIIRKNTISESCVISSDDEPGIDMYLELIRMLCDKLDLEMPIVLSKHRNDMEVFNLVSFLPSDFIEKVDFQRFDIEIFIEKDNNKKRKLNEKKRKTNAQRNII